MLSQMMRWGRVPPEEALREVLVLVATGWEVPLPGVREWNEEVLATLLELAADGDADAGAGVRAEGRARAALSRLADVEGLLGELVHRTSWRSKRKYLEMKVLARRYRGDLLADHPVLLQGLLLAMASSHLASAATGVYTVLLARQQRQRGAEQWQRQCLAAIVAALAAADRCAGSTASFHFCFCFRYWPRFCLFFLFFFSIESNAYRNC